MSLDDVISDLSALGGLPVYLATSATFILLKDFGTFWRLFLGLVIAYVIISVVRSFYIRDRPKPVLYRTWWQKIDAGTAVSMHSMRAAILAIVLMDVFQKIWLSTFFIVVALLVASTRAFLKKHYFSDCVWGVVLGTLTGFFVVWLA